MSVSSISSGIGTNPADWRSTVKQGKQDFSQLLGALQSGDVSGAQQAYSAMQQLLPGFQSATGSSANTASSTAATAVSADFSALGAALSSGSLSGAQSAVATLQQDALSYAQSRYGNHDVAASQKATAGTSNPVAANGTNNAIGADMAALGQALQSGSATSAQQAFAQLQQDLQAASQSVQQGQGTEHRHHHHSASGAQNSLASYIANSVVGSDATTAATTTGSTSTSVNVSA